MQEVKSTQALKEYLLVLFDGAKKGEMDGCTVPLGRLTEDGKRYLANISGLGFKAFTDIAVNASELRHIYNEHYGDNEKDKGNNIPLTDEDIINMVDVISKPESIVFLGKNPINGVNNFAFLKRATVEGTYNLLEIYGKAGGCLTAKTFYKTKKGINRRIMELNPQLSTSKTTGESLSSAARKIPRMLIPLPLLGKDTTEASENQILEQKNEPTPMLEKIMKTTAAKQDSNNNNHNNTLKP
ncbi:MAG: hypothetical protein LBK47_07980 [Prevotellaceae bacterium]|jgi:hypothetical protein|nr:hypothetical protein [Prevotellaceae bacterium]